MEDARGSLDRKAAVIQVSAGLSGDQTGTVVIDRQLVQVAQGVIELSPLDRVGMGKAPIEEQGQDVKLEEVGLELKTGKDRRGDGPPKKI